MIEIKNLTKKFSSKTVLDDINLTITKGENIGILGANGSGKTTLVEIICGIQKFNDGQIVYANEINKVVGIQFQEGTWPAKTRAIDLIEFFQGKNWKNNEYVSSIFSVFEIKDILKLEINKLSGGQKQRLNCFLAIINNPSLIVIDELITGLDLKMQMKLLRYFKTLKERQDVTMLIVSHIPDEIELLCDRVIILKDGKIFEDRTLKSILKEHKNVREYIEKYFDDFELNDESN